MRLPTTPPLRAAGGHWAGPTIDARGRLRWDTAGVADGAYRFRVTATDAAGNRRTRTKTIIVRSS